MERIWLAAAALCGAVSVAADAVARHLLAADPHRLDLAATAARYGLWHAAALVAMVALRRVGGQAATGRTLAAAGWCFVAGMAFFCGGLMLLAAGAPAAVARVVPAGGLLFIAGWIALLLYALGPRRAA